MKLLLFGLIAMLAAATGCSKQGGGEQKLDYDHLREAVITHIKDGSISPDASGKTVLPQNLKAACKEGYIYISTDQPAGFSVIFIENAGSEDQQTPESGMLYCENGVQAPWSLQKIRVAGIDWRLIRIQDDHFCSVARM